MIMIVALDFVLVVMTSLTGYSCTFASAIALEGRPEGLITLLSLELVSRAGVVRIAESFDSSTHKDWERSEMSHALEWLAGRDNSSRVMYSASHCINDSRCDTNKASG
jgi:hypothetical protein